MIERNVNSKILKKDIIHNYKHLINRKYNIFVKKYMENKAGLKKKNYIYFVNFKNYLTNSFNIFRKKKLTSLVNNVESKFV